MEEVETDNAVILKCCHEPEDSRKGRRNLQHMAREKKLDENNQHQLMQMTSQSYYWSSKEKFSD